MNTINSNLTIKDISVLERKSIKTIRRAIASKQLFAEKRVGNFFSISNDDYIEWKNNGYKTNSIPERVSAFVDRKYTPKYSEAKFVDVSREMQEIDGWNSTFTNGIKFLDLFSGAGGLSCGLVMAGFEPVQSVEILECAVDTFKINFIDSKRFPEKIIETKDIRDSKVKKEIIKICLFQKVELIVGGFPCQGFSMSGNRVIADARNSLYLDMLDIVKKVRPKIVIMENVEGLRNMLNGKIEQMIISDYQKVGYNISVQTLNAADYGVAQKRKRVVFVANNINVQNFYPQPIFEKENYRTLGQELKRFLNIKENPSINHCFTNHTENMKKRLSAVPEGKSLYSNYSDSWKKSPWNQPSCTIKENHGGVNIHPKKSRVLTARELAALQSFPDDFIFSGTKKWQLLQIGNAVPPLMAKAIGLAVWKLLKDNKSSF